MKLFNENQILADVVSENHLLFPVINRLGVNLGFKNSTIRTVCNENKIDIEFFIEIINVFNNENYFPQKKLQQFSVSTIINYLNKTHEFYRNYYITEIDKLIKQLLSNENIESKVICKFYNNYKNELIEHLKFEETIVFPYIIELSGLGVKKLSAKKKIKYSINDFEKEHSNIDNKISDLRNFIIRYLSVYYDFNTCNSLLSSLFLFEKDLQNHTRIEEKILFPKAKYLEKSVITK